MSVYLTNPWGDTVEAPNLSDLQKFLDCIDPADAEHGAAWLTDDDGTVLEYSGDGKMVLSRNETETLTQFGVSKSQALQMWLAFSEGRIDELESLAWSKVGNLHDPDDAEQRIKALLLDSDREFYASLGNESAVVHCRSPGCSRGAIEHSVFCRSHHVLNVRGRIFPR
jgi:hypothetical protein